jgi:hypothetical protein
MMYLQPTPAIGIAVSVVVGAIAVGAESYGLIAWFGRVFERAEPSTSVTAR